ncbi:MAG: aminotransferase class I/II-fold pyridoxal phosphate-dependent enzyme [Acidobacteriota bacterium]
MSRPDKSLELSQKDMRRLLSEAARRVFSHIRTLPVQPAADTEGAAELARSLIEPLPRQGQPYEELMALLFEKLVPKSYNTPGPGYLAYIPGGGLFHSAVADFIADGVNRYVGVWAAAPALAQLEANVIRWFSEIVGYPQTARGILTSGGSLASFSAIFTARRERLQDDFLSGIIYASDQTHHSIQKAATLVGFPAANVHVIGTDAQFRIRLDELERRIAADRAAGLTPFLVVGNAGTTNTGAIDDLGALADLAQRERLWLHVDAAYGGFFMLTDRGREAMKGIERADSLILDPHKGLFLPYGTGCLLVRDGEALKRAHATTADYMPHMQEDPDFVDFCQYSPELSRDFRGLRAWLPIKMHGIEPFRRNLQEKLDLAQWAARRLRKIPGIEIIAEPQLSVLAFRLVKPALDTVSLNRLNRDLLARINSRQHVHLTATMLGDRYAIRICVLSFRTHIDRMRAAIRDIRQAAAAS